jgi:hypothetical protein
MLRRAASLRSILTALVAALVAVSLPSGLPAQDRRPEEVKAGYLRSLPRYFTWPKTSFADAQAPFVIGVIGEDPFGRELDRLIAGTKVKNRRMGLKRFPAGGDGLPSPEELGGVHMLYVSASEKERVPEILELVEGSPVVTVSDVEMFAEAGGVVELALIGAYIKPVLNRSVADAAGLQVSSKLSKMAIPAGSKR